MNKKILVAEIKILRKTKQWTTPLYMYFNEIVEAVVSTYGKDLEREEAIQESWALVIKLIPKIRLRENIGAYVYTCLRNYISDMREYKYKHKHVSLEDVGTLTEGQQFSGIRIHIRLKSVRH
jgi:DNA-directed RNA polymerase specialized sigma24 family protein